MSEAENHVLTAEEFAVIATNVNDLETEVARLTAANERLTKLVRDLEFCLQ